MSIRGSRGARVYVVQGKTWRKLYCAACVLARCGAPEDTGELLELESLPAYPKQFLDFTGTTRPARTTERTT